MYLHVCRREGKWIRDVDLQCSGHWGQFLRDARVSWPLASTVMMYSQWYHSIFTHINMAETVSVEHEVRNQLG
jgi:hypothetical protein